jgi:hypothetical protein
MKTHYRLLTEGFPFCLTSTTIFTHRDHKVPWFPFYPIGGFLIFVSSLHHWILFRESLSCTIPSGACRIRTSVWSLQFFHSSHSKSMTFYYPLMLDDRGCPNSFLPTDLFLSTSAHLTLG